MNKLFLGKKIQNAIKNYLDNPNTHWQQYKQLFQISVLRYLVSWFAFVPIVASLFSLIPQKIQIKILNNSIEYFISLKLPFDWKLLWLSSFFFVTAFLLRLIFCPSFVRKYNSYREYKNQENSPRYIVWEARKCLIKKNPKFIERLLKKKYFEEVPQETFIQKLAEFHRKPCQKANREIEYFALVEESQTSLFYRFRDACYKLSMPQMREGNTDFEKTDYYEKDLFWEIFGNYSSAKPLIRFLVSLFLFISAILFSIVLLQNIINGMKSIF